MSSGGDGVRTSESAAGPSELDLDHVAKMKKKDVAVMMNSMMINLDKVKFPLKAPPEPLLEENDVKTESEHIASKKASLITCWNMQTVCEVLSGLVLAVDHFKDEAKENN